MKTNYETGFQDGIHAAMDLVRAGCSGDDLALLMARDPAAADPCSYSDHLRQLTAILDTSGLFGVTP